MASMTPHSRGLMSAIAEQRLREARRRRYARRRIMALVLLLATLAGAYFALDWLLDRFSSRAEGSDGTASALAPAALSFKPVSFLPAGDLNGDGVEEQVALGPVKETRQPVALVTTTGSGPKQLGQALALPALPLAVRNLSGAPSVLVLSGKLPATGETKSVTIPGGQAVEAAGGEPYFQAWRLDVTRGLVPANYYELAAPVNPPAPTSLIADKWLNVLWFYKDGRLEGTYRVGTGKFLEGPPPTAGNQERNYITPVGTYTITYKEVDPPYYKENIRGGDPANPLGPRFMGFQVYPGDKAKVWGIHGTNEPDSIGRWASNGCIRMNNDELVALFGQVPEGTVLEIRHSGPR